MGPTRTLSFEERVRRYAIEHLGNEVAQRVHTGFNTSDIYVFADFWDLDDSRLSEWNIELEHEEPYQYSEYTGGGGNTDLWATIPMGDGTTRRLHLGGGDEAATTFHTIIRELVK